MEIGRVGNGREHRMKRLIIFDWDGVIADSCASYFDFYRVTSEHFGRTLRPRTVDEFRQWYDSTWENNFTNIGFTAEELNSAKAFQMKLVDYDEIPLFPAMPPVLRRLSEKFSLAIASTTHSSHIRLKLRAEQLDSLFCCVSGGEGGTSDKRGIIGKTLDTAEISPHCAVMVGDTPMDIASARAVGIRNIGVTFGWISPERMAEASPDYIARVPEEIPPILERIFPSPEE